MAACRWCREPSEETGSCPACGRPVAEDPAARVGAAVGAHRLDRLVGEGPIGAVYEGLHLPSGRKVRVKAVDSSLLAAEPGLAAGATQLVLGCAGIHPGVPELVELALESGELPVVSTEWVDGRTMQELLAGGAIDPAEAVRIGLGLLEVVDALHQSGLGHRDIKPSNVLVVPAGSPAPVCLLDAGLSLVSSRARTGAHYRSSEQARGAENIGLQTDIYGVGVVLYEALTGRRPFDSNDYDVLMSRLSVRHPDPLAALRPDLPAGLTGAVDRAMAPAPSERFGSAREMAEVLQSALAAAGLGAVPPGPAALAPAPAAGPPPPVAPAVAQAAPAVVTTAPPPLLEPEPVTVGRGRRTGRGVAAAFFIGLALAAGGGMLWYTIWGAEEPAAPPTVGAERPAAAPPRDDGKTRGTIRVRLSGVPAGARITVDGRPLGANPFRAPRDNVVHAIRVEAPRHEPFETTLTFAEDRDVAVEMEPIEESPELGDFRAHKSGPGANVVRHRTGPIKIANPRGKRAVDPEAAQLRSREAASPR